MDEPASASSSGGRGCWVDVPEGSPFPLHNLPFGIGRRADGTVGAFAAIGDEAVDLDDAVGTGFLDETPIEHGTVDRDRRLNTFFGRGREAVEVVRARIAELLTDPAAEARLRPSVCPRDEIAMLVPVRVGDYVDFYSSLHHATNLGRLFRPDGEALLPNWRHIPVGYHGRAGTIVPTDVDIARPHGVRMVDGEPRFGPSQRLDIELEVGAIVGRAPSAGQPVAAGAEEHLAGLCLVNDWSARDIQAFEYQPLGPFLGKSFATSISPWVVTLDALAPFRVDPPDQDPPVADYLRTTGPTGFDLRLEVLIESAAMRAGGIEPFVVSRTRFDDMYWTPAQQLAHIVVNGATTQPGDLFASGTVSGPNPGSEGSLIELTRGGERPVELPDGTTRTFLEDDDRVILRGWAGDDPADRIGLGTVAGTIVATRRGEEH